MFLLLFNNSSVLLLQSIKIVTSKKSVTRTRKKKKKLLFSFLGVPQGNQERCLHQCFPWVNLTLSWGRNVVVAVVDEDCARRDVRWAKLIRSLVHPRRWAEDSECPFATSRRCCYYCSTCQLLEIPSRRCRYLDLPMNLRPNDKTLRTITINLTLRFHTYLLHPKMWLLDEPNPHSDHHLKFFKRTLSYIHHRFLGVSTENKWKKSQIFN